MAAAPPTVQPEKKTSRTGYRIGFATVGTLVLLILLLLPFSVSSILTSIVRPPSDAYDYVTPWEYDQNTWGDLVAIEIVAFDEIQQLATLRVIGVHVCQTECTYQDRVTFYAADADPSFLGYIPVSESVVLPADRTEVSTKFQLPVEGNLIHYPFDQYRLRLGVTVQRESADKTVRQLSADELRDHLILVTTEAIPRLGLNPAEVIDIAPYQGSAFGPKYGFIGLLTLERPNYLKVLVVSVVLLIGAAASFAVFMRPFDQLIINAGALVLGVWGARSMLLGSYPPDVTAVDTALTTIILLLLLSISFRVLNYLHLKAGLSILPWVKTPAPPPAPPAAVPAAEATPSTDGRPTDTSPREVASART